MTTYRCTTTLLAALSTAVVVGALLPMTPASAVSPSPAAPLDWTACGPEGQGQECAKLTVPLDYRDPAGEQIALAVTRIRSTRPEARRGTLMMIPGGPGGSGVERLTQKGPRLAQETGGAYDLVAFDPRGVGGSTRANCRLDAADRLMVTLRSWPAADGRVDENIARSRRTAEACARNGGAILDSLTTANQVRDLDRLRRALGERRLSAWGTSYGAYVAAQYAQKFPHRTDRIVLDSSADPDPKRVAQGWMRDMAKGAEDRFPDFAAWAAHADRGGLRLAERPEDVRPLFLALAARLDREPVPSTTPGVAVDGNVLRQALQNALYSDGAFSSMARLIKAAQDPAAGTDPTRRPVLPPALTGPLGDEDAAITVGVICNDVRWTGTVADYRTAVAADRTAHPLTAGMPANITPCTFWKTPASAEEPTRLTSDGPSDILMIQNRRDPATPHSSGLKMRAALGDRARLVTVERGGHGVYLGNGNACGDATVTRFLLTGERPERDTTCP
ncbi:alpha/beta hydrolase [Streptomyces sp. HUAS MG47]|uniref:alpha/beta hydrolase n=1 Tax=Streptomyces solicamelliae TaxID=3231716 RepID=UPI003877F882